MSQDVRMVHAQIPYQWDMGGMTLLKSKALEILQMVH